VKPIALPADTVAASRIFVMLSAGGWEFVNVQSVTLPDSITMAPTVSPDFVPVAVPFSRTHVAESRTHPLGTVSAVENYGAGDLLEIARPEGQNSLIAFKPGVADLAAGRITLDPDFLA